MNATKRPWTLPLSVAEEMRGFTGKRESWNVTDADGVSIARCSRLEKGKQRAAEIVRAVNGYDAMRETLEHIKRLVANPDMTNGDRTEIILACSDALKGQQFVKGTP